MGALVVIILWLGINILVELFGENKSKKSKRQVRKQVIRTEEKIYDFDLFNELDEPQRSYFKKSA